MNIKKVIYVGNQLSLSGSTMVMLDVLNHLDRDKYAPHLILKPGSRMDAAHLLKDDVIVHHPRHLRSWWSRCYVEDFRFRRYLENVVRTNSESVFIVDHTKYNGLFSNFKKKHRIKVVNRVGTIISWRLKNGINLKGEKRIARSLLPYSDYIVVPSFAVKNDLVNSFSIDPSIIRVIYNSLDSKKVGKNALEELSYETDLKTLLFVGRLVSKKYPMLLLDAFKDMSSENNDVELWFVGDGDQRRQLEEYVTVNKLGSNIKFWGLQKNPYKFMKQADVFIHTSQMEGFGIALMEAAYFNLPIVYSDTLVGANELLKKHNIGYPFDINSKRDLIDSIQKALTRPKKAYFDLLKSDISIDNFIRKYEETIEKVIAGSEEAIQSASHNDSSG